MGRRSAKIATRKNKADAGKLIAQAVRAGGPDATANAKLREVLQQAKLAQLPTDIIDRNIKKASEKNAADFAEVTYEAYGPGGSGFVIECLTDNVNRSASEVRTAIIKSGGKVADPGSVLFNFQRQGLVMVDAKEDEDKVFEAAMEAGASDVQPSKDDDGKLEGYKVLMSVEEFGTVNSGLQEQGVAINLEGSGLVYMPLMLQEVDDDAHFEANEAMLERLLAVDDVDAVYTNCGGLQ
ncbi:hypothetical protein N2152v2_005906 [Parachlorella kessleri]